MPITINSLCVCQITSTESKYRVNFSRLSKTLRATFVSIIARHAVHYCRSRQRFDNPVNLSTTC
jgi:hypothetical protein